MKPQHYDVIVLGVGSMGSATCYQLAKRGMKVLGLEQFGIPHERGEHAGQSRLIRKAYFEHPDYVPLLELAYRNWQQLEGETGVQVYHQTGILYMGHPQHDLLQGVNTSAQQFKLRVDALSQANVRQQYPQFKLPSDFETLWEPESGFLEPEKAIRQLVAAAIRNGATILENTAVLDWKSEGSGVKVVTATQTFVADKLVICAGPWTGKLIPDFNRQLSVTRQILAWVTLPQPEHFSMGVLPCWTLAAPDKPGIFYGFPVLDEKGFDGPVGLKLAHHAPGMAIDPDNQDVPPHAGDEAVIREFLEQYIPEAAGGQIYMRGCRYTNTPDEHFILDHLPGYGGRVSIAAGFSGHGFKFVSAVGEIMADLAIQGHSIHPIRFLSSDRFTGHHSSYGS